MSNIIGEINDKEKSEFLSGAIVLLVPIDWPEPFGLVMIEAMACGTPVIAFNRGSVPEVIDDGVTGFIVEDINGAIGAVDRLGSFVARENPHGISRSASPRGAWRRTISASIAALPTAWRRICAWSPTTRRRCSTPRPLYCSSSSGRVSGIRNHSTVKPTSAIAASPAKAERAAEAVAHVAGEGRAERSADADRGADDALAEIEMAGAAREIGDHQRHHDGEHRRGDAVEQAARRPAAPDCSPRRTEGRGSAARQSRSAATAGAPKSGRGLPTHGDSSATTSCGTTMQAAISTVAHWLERMVTTLPINGSMAALARWNSNRQPAKISSGRLCISSPGLGRAACRCAGAARRRGRVRDRSRSA